jgi:hypothetical protein
MTGAALLDVQSKCWVGGILSGCSGGAETKTNEQPHVDPAASTATMPSNVLPMVRSSFGSELSPFWK